MDFLDCAAKFGNAPELTLKGWLQRPAQLFNSFNAFFRTIKNTSCFITRSLLFFPVCVLFFFTCFGQTGPGGAGETDGSSSLEYWIDASSQTEATAGDLTQIPDLSGNDIVNTIIGTPILAENYVNQRSAIFFNGANEQILTDSFINAALYPNLTIVAVYRPAITASGSVWGDYQFGWEGRYLTNNNVNPPRTSNFVGPGFDPVDGTHPSTGIPGLFPTAQWTITSVVYREDVPNGTRVRVNGAQVRSFTTNHNPGAYNPFTVGAGGPNYAGNPFWFNGHVAEVIVFSEALSDLDLIMVENYLSAKYNIALSDNDLFTGDDITFDYDVAGIGRTDASTVTLATRGTGIVSIEAASIGTGQFLLWGHNNGTLDATETTDIPATVDARSSRMWYVSEVDIDGAAVDIGDLSITFDLTNYDDVTASDLVLLVDTDDDGEFSDEVPIVGATELTDNVCQFQNLSAIANGSRFTFGTSNISGTPLPIVLLDFRIDVVNDTLLEFYWSTASELNNDYFEILESEDAITWRSIQIIPGSGNTNNRTEYHAQYQDLGKTDKMYYKLLQVDFDGTTTDLKVEVINRKAKSGVSMFPNPATSIVNIDGGDLERVVIYDSGFRSVKSFNQSKTIVVDDLADGIYWVYIYLKDELLVKRLIIRSH